MAIRQTIKDVLAGTALLLIGLGAGWFGHATAGDNPETNSDLQRCAEVGAEYGKPMGRIEYLERAEAQDYERELSLRVVVNNPEYLPRPVRRARPRVHAAAGASAGHCLTAHHRLDGWLSIGRRRMTSRGW